MNKILNRPLYFYLSVRLLGLALSLFAVSHVARGEPYVSASESGKLGEVSIKKGGVEPASIERRRADRVHAQWIAAARACLSVGTPLTSAAATSQLAFQALPPGYPSFDVGGDGSDQGLPKNTASDDVALVTRLSGGESYRVDFYHHYGKELKKIASNTFLRMDPREMGRTLCYDLGYMAPSTVCPRGGVKVSFKEIFNLPEGSSPEDYPDENGAPRKNREAAVLPCFEEIETSSSSPLKHIAPPQLTEGRVVPRDISADPHHGHNRSRVPARPPVSTLPHRQSTSE